MRACSIRKLAAFLIAPAITPLLLFPWFLLVVFPSSPQWVRIGTFVAMIFSYAGTAAFGAFGLAVLARRGIVSLPAAIIYGAISALCVGIMFWLLFAIALDGLSWGWESFLESSSLPSIIYPALACCFLGGLTGAVFWLIARPDKQSFS